MKKRPDVDLSVVNLHPGELFVARRPTLISTILGSCVSVCLFCARQKIGAMCHGVLPVSPNQDSADSFRFVETSIHYMVACLTSDRKLCNRAGLIAKIFGGADVLTVRPASAGGLPSVGSLNIQAARAALEREDVPVLVEKVGGVVGCKMFFYTHTGEVLLRPFTRHSPRQ